MPNTNRTIFDNINIRTISDNNLEVTSDMARTAGIRTAGNIGISTARTFVNFPRIGANPEEGQYLNFEATFTVGSGGGSWDQPYIRCWIFVDSNENGVQDSGEGLVNNAFYNFINESTDNHNIFYIIKEDYFMFKFILFLIKSFFSLFNKDIFKIFEMLIIIEMVQKSDQKLLDILSSAFQSRKTFYS